MNKVINISSNGIKQAIDDLINENEMLQDKVYKLEDIIKEVREYITSEEYFNLNNQKTGKFSKDSENYFKAHDKLLNILQGR